MVGKTRYPEHIDRLAYEKKGVLIITMPLNQPGYYANTEEAGAFIVVKSELRKMERSEIINWGLRQHKKSEVKRTEIYGIENQEVQNACS